MTGKLAVVGSTSWYHIDMPSHNVFNVVLAIIQYAQPEMVFSGRSPKGGVDIWAEQIAGLMGIPFKGFPPDGYGWLALKARNMRMAEACDELVAIRSTSSTTYGSGWTADYAEKLGKPVHRVVI